MSQMKLAATLAFLFPIALLVVSVRWLLEERKVARLLLEAGKTVEADILKLGTESLGHSSRCFVTYRFAAMNVTPERHSFRRTQSISEKHLRKLQGASTVTVRYLPQKPEISRLSVADRDDTRQKSLQLYIFLAVCGLAIGFLWFMFS